MIHALLWKEYRTQRMAWVALALVNAASMLGLPALIAQNGLDSNPDARITLHFVAIALAWTYGLVCGALLLAGERESGTLTFLDALPGFRRNLWATKLLAGVLLLAAQIVVLAALAGAGRLFLGWHDFGWTCYGMVCGGLYGFAWGLLFSAYGRSVLNMILLALGAQVAAAFLLSLAGIILTGVASVYWNLSPNSGATVSATISGVLGLLTVPLALVVSAARFTRLDRSRLRQAPDTLRRAMGGRRLVTSWRVLFWLTWRQARGFAAGMAAFALFLGFIVLAQGLLLWPIATLLIGVLCGATAFADEQQGPFRFVGDQRFPLVRLWLVKIGLRAAIAAGATLIVLAPMLMVAVIRLPDVSAGGNDREGDFLIRLLQSHLVIPLVRSLGAYLTVWLVSGFSAGCLCGVLFRSGLASGVFALFLGTTLSVVWIPSMLQGGLHLWQVLGAPALLLGATLPLLRPWAAGRIVSWTAAKRLAPFAVLAAIWVAAGLAYRVWEIPDVALPFDMNAFAAGLPKPDDNKAGDLVRSACAQFDELSRKVNADQGGQAGMGGGPAAAPGAPPAAMAAPGGRPDPLGRARLALTHGWPAADPELGAWLDDLSNGDWVQSLRESADLPPGTIENLRLTTRDSSLRTVEPARQMGIVLAARGLQRQAAGHDEAYVDNLRLGLALARALRHHAPRLEALTGFSVESDLLSGLDPWMQRLDGRPDLLRQALGLLSDYLATAPADEADQGIVDYFIVHNSLDDPIPCVKACLTMDGSLPDNDGEALQREAQWVALAGLLTPWERERQERQLRYMFADPAVGRLRDIRWQWLLAMELEPFAAHPSAKPIRECRERAMQLKLALRLYQAENGKPAQTLDELIPKYLPAIPPDPYDGCPFRYRLSAHEQILWPEDQAPPGAVVGGPPAPGAAMGGPPQLPVPPMRDVPAGQGILWSTGPDKRDDGGHRQVESSDAGYQTGGDMIFLVPLPPKAK